MSTSIAKWLIIIGKILIIMGQGIPKAEAVSRVAAEFGVSESEIWEHGGF